MINQEINEIYWFDDADTPYVIPTHIIDKLWGIDNFCDLIGLFMAYYAMSKSHKSYETHKKLNTGDEKPIRELDLLKWGKSKEHKTRNKLIQLGLIAETIIKKEDGRIQHRQFELIFKG